jgi:hypothetical protein
MAMETLGEGYRLGWQLTARCAFGPRDGMNPSESATRTARHATLVWTRGPNFPPEPPRKSADVPAMRLSPRNRAVPMPIGGYLRRRRFVRRLGATRLLLGVERGEHALGALSKLCSWVLRTSISRWKAAVRAALAGPCLAGRRGYLVTPLPRRDDL